MGGQPQFQMKKLLFAALVLAAVVGCEPKQQDAAMAAGQSAWKKAGESWDTVYKQAAKLTADSSAAALKAAREQLVKAQASLKDNEQVKALQDQIARIDAAIDVQKIKADLEAKVEEAKQAKENATKTVDDIQTKLHQADQAYQSLEAKLADAQKAYDSAAAKISGN